MEGQTIFGPGLDTYECSGHTSISRAEAEGHLRIIVADYEANGPCPIHSAATVQIQSMSFVRLMHQNVVEHPDCLARGLIRGTSRKMQRVSPNSRTC